MARVCGTIVIRFYYASVEDNEQQPGPYPHAHRGLGVLRASTHTDTSTSAHCTSTDTDVGTHRITRPHDLLMRKRMTNRKQT